jgi:hypothetical protein
MNIMYQCEKCDDKFNSEDYCLEHEKECKLLYTHLCDKCGKNTEYAKESKYSESYIEESLWTFTPNHYRAGYGSRLDGSEFILNLCDDCLCEFVASCVHEKRIKNSGSNTYYDYPDEDDLYDEDNYKEDFENYQSNDPTK